jgi:hypothetical protein
MILNGSLLHTNLLAVSASDLLMGDQHTLIARGLCGNFSPKKSSDGLASRPVQLLTTSSKT